MDDQFATAILIPPTINVVEEVDPERIEGYWTAVRETLRTVFGEDNPASMVEAARERLRRTPVETQQFFYHASPFQVASDLAGVTETGLSDRQLSSYRAIISAFDPTLYPPAS